MFQSRTKPVAATAAVLSVLALGCADAPEPDTTHRAGVQLISPTLDLASVDLCWSTQTEEIAVALDAQLQDDDATGLLALPLDPSLQVSLVPPGGDCSDTPLAEVSLDASTVGESSEAVTLVLSGSLDGEVGGQLVTVPETSEDETSWRLADPSGGCDPGHVRVSRVTHENGTGGCQTRVKLYTCEWDHVFMEGTQWGYNLTYDSGWVDCSDPCLH